MRESSPQREELIDLHRVPPNVQFEVDDVENEWTYNTPFDLIHSRFMYVDPIVHIVFISELRVPRHNQERLRLTRLQGSLHYRLAKTRETNFHVSCPFPGLLSSTLGL